VTGLDILLASDAARRHRRAYRRALLAAALDSGQIIATMPDPGQTEVASLAYRPGGRLLAVGDMRGHIYLWRVPVA
jgi:HAMP domain-containing protein